MRIYLSGAHQHTNLRLLTEAGATHVGMSFHLLRPRLPKRSAFLVAERFAPAMEVYLASGGHSLSKLSKEGVDDFVRSWSEFVDNNASSLSLVTEVDDPRVDPLHREEYAVALGERFVPVWLEETGVRGLESLAERFQTIGIRAEIMRSSPMLAARLNPLRARYGTRWHVLDGARPDELVSGRFDSAATTAWISPMKYGETLVFDGNRMVRYPKRQQDQARRRHRALFTKAGYDADAILEGDHEELTRYTISAFLQLESHLDRRKPSTNPFRVVTDETAEELSTSSPGSEARNGVEEPPEHVDNLPAVVRNENRAPARRENQSVLPVVGFETSTETITGPDGEPVDVERLLMRSSNTTLRACDTCHVAATCPAFNPGSECAFKLPVEIKTKDQLMASMASLLEMQMQRVAFMRFQEELNGGYSDPNTSQEMDRFMRLVTQMKEVQDNREYLRMEIKAKSEGGVLSALIGKRAQQLADLDQPVSSDIIIDSYLDDSN